MISLNKFLPPLCIFLLSCCWISGGEAARAAAGPGILWDLLDTSRPVSLSRLVRTVRHAIIRQERSFADEGNGRFKRQMAQMQKITMAPMDFSAIQSLNRKPSYVSAVSQSHAQQIDKKNPSLSLADSLAFTLDIQGPLGDSSSEYQGNQNFGKGAKSSAASKGGSGQNGGPALAAADTSADIVVDGDVVGSAATVNKADVHMSGNAAGVSNARGSVGAAPGKANSDSPAPAIPSPAVQPVVKQAVPVASPTDTVKTTQIASIATSTSTTRKTTSTTTPPPPATVAPLVDVIPTAQTGEGDDDGFFLPTTTPRRHNNHERNQNIFGGGPQTPFFSGNNVGFGNNKFGFNSGMQNSFAPLNQGFANTGSRGAQRAEENRRGGGTVDVFGDMGFASSPNTFPSLFGSSPFGPRTFPSFSNNFQRNI